MELKEITKMLVWLLARKIEFIHPVKNENIIITAPTPTNKIWNACLAD